MVKGWEFLRFWKQWPEMLKKIQAVNAIVLPQRKDLFKALQLTPFNEVKCVILGQDPYPTKGYANGLAFSVYPHVSPVPRSLRNIFTEYESDLGYHTPRTGDLSSWASNGVLLLNSILTVEEGKPLSHAGLGWEKLTFEIIRSLDARGNCVFVLWGQKAKEYGAGVRSNSVIWSVHPSPLSANQGFFGSKPFSRVNNILKGQGLKPIDWKLP